MTHINLAIGWTGFLTGAVIVIVVSSTPLPLKLKILMDFGGFLMVLMGGMLAGHDD